MKIIEELFDYFKQVGTIKTLLIKNEIIYMQDDFVPMSYVLWFKKAEYGVYHIKKW